MSKALILVGMGVGASLMYVFDPQQGNRRRALARDKVAKAIHTTGHAVGATSRDVAHRATGLAASLHGRFFEDNAPDDVVEARVRARLGRVVSHPHAIEVSAQNGVITLRGPVFSPEAPEVLKAVRSVRGVERVENRLEPHATAGTVPGVQGPGPRIARRVAGFAPGEWAPTTTIAVGVAGAVLAGVGLLRRDRLGMLLGGIGLAIIARSGVSAAITTMRQYAARSHEPAAGHEQRSANETTEIPVKIGPRREGETSPWPGEGADPGRVH